MDKRLSPALIIKLRSAVTYRREHVSCCFHLTYDYCQSLSEDGSDLYHGVKSNILDRFKQVTNRTEISSSAVLSIELSSVLKKDNHSGTCELFNNIKKLSSVSARADIISDLYFNNSTKNLNRNGRGYGVKLLFNDDIPLPSKFNDSFLKNNDNKERLNLYCADKFQSYQEDNSLIQCNKVIRESFSVTNGESVLSLQF